MPRLALEVDGHPQGDLTPFLLEGEEAISSLYRFVVSCLVSPEMTRPVQLGAAARLTFSADDRDAGRVVHGVVWEIEDADPVLNDQRVCRITVMPRLSWLGLGQYSQVHALAQRMSVLDLIAAATEGRLHAGMQIPDPSMPRIPCEVQSQYKAYETDNHIAQHEESDLAFLSRLCERYGIWYSFKQDQAAATDVAVFSDSNIFAPFIAGNAKLHWADWAPGRGTAPERSILSMVQTNRPTPATAWMRDYTDVMSGRPNKQSAQVACRRTVGDKSFPAAWTASAYWYRSEAEGQLLSRVQAELLACRAVRFTLRTNADEMQPGYLFTPKGHPYPDFNDVDMLVVSVRHRLRMPGAPVTIAPSSPDVFGYENTVVAIPESVPFRPEKVTAPARIYGLMTGLIEGPPGQKEPYLDERGRYRVRLTPDYGDRPEGEASRWIPKAEPYSGLENGMHFPLPPGTPVVVSFVNGDPDRPVVVGALTPATSTSMVVQASNWTNRIVSRTGIVVTLGDRRLSNTPPSGTP